jgi:hypothetical protein
MLNFRGLVPFRVFAGISFFCLPAFVGCGQDPAFTETGLVSVDPYNPDSTMGESDAEVDQSASEEASSDGIETGDGDNNSSGSTAYTPPPGYPTNTPESDVLIEDGGSLALPGSKAVKVGINFEDLSDFDLNDSVLCFTGDFKVQGASVVSYKKQTVNAAVTNNSACGHNIHVTIKNRDGLVTQRFSYNDRITSSATMNFDVGSTLWVVMENQPNNHGCIGPIAMNHPSRAEVKPNLCRR